MTTSPSRRAFLTGRRPAQSPWRQFCGRLRRGISGELLDFGLYQGVGSARLTPADATDVRRARALCAEYGVVLALDGLDRAGTPDGRSVLWVELGASLAGCQPLPGHEGRWFVQPGCLLGELCQAGLTQFADQPAYLTAAAWLADRSLCAWRPGETRHSGLLHAAVLLADGTTATLGPFGPDARLPLDSLALQKLVPALFQLASGPQAQACRALARWPARYRLDALLPGEGQDVNLSHLLLGHGGDLAWAEWLVFEQRPPGPRPDSWEAAYSSRPAAGGGEALRLAAGLDAGVKAAFDPGGVFPNPGQDL